MTSVLAWAVLGLRAAAAIVVLTTLVGGIPRVVQGALAVTIGAWTALVVGPPGAGGDVIALAVSELALGAALGLMAAIPLVAAQTAGRLVDVAGQQKTYATLFGVLAAAVFVGIDGHVAVGTAMADALAHDSRREDRTRTRKHYFGDLGPGDSSRKFEAAVADLIAERDRLLTDHKRVTPGDVDAHT